MMLHLAATDRRLISLDRLAVSLHADGDLAVLFCQISQRQPVISRQRRYANLPMPRELPIIERSNYGIGSLSDLFAVGHYMKGDSCALYSRNLTLAHPPIKPDFPIRIVGHHREVSQVAPRTVTHECLLRIERIRAVLFTQAKR